LREAISARDAWSARRGSGSMDQVIVGSMPANVALLSLDSGVRRLMETRGMLIAPIALLSCAMAGALQASELDSNSLDAAEQTWANAGVRSYEFTFAYNILVSPCKWRTLHFKVRNGKALSQRRCRDLQSEFGSVPQLFEFLRGALTNKHASIDAEFDADYGYPRRVFIDFGVPDFFEGFSVASFRVRSGRGS
jgi:hypothetical protein